MKKQPLIGVAVAMAVIMGGPAGAQAQFPAATSPDPYGYRLNATTPDDAYRQRLINRWELEQLVGPTPQALQGPSPNGGGFAPGSN